MSVRTEQDEEEHCYFISITLIACVAAIMVLLILILAVQLVIGWGPIFKKLFDVLAIS